MVARPGSPLGYLFPDDGCHRGPRVTEKRLVAQPVVHVLWQPEGEWNPIGFLVPLISHNSLLYHRDTAVSKLLPGFLQCELSAN